MPAYMHHHDIEMAPVICPGCIGMLPMYVRDVEPHWSMAKIDFIYECSDCGAEVRHTVRKPCNWCTDRPDTPGPWRSNTIDASSPSARRLTILTRDDEREAGTLARLIRLPASAAAEIAFSEVIGDLVERALLPLFGLRQPESPALGIQRGALAADDIPDCGFRRACS